MNERIAALAKWLGGQFNGFGAFLESVGHQAVTQSKFVNLAPTDQADKDGVYSEALFFATTDPKVSNIALTGPYGSGKSSIIQSFLKKYQRLTLHISLAAFVQDADAVGGKVSRQEIERSILQQMLYGADANKLPLSRFKRIQSPGVYLPEFSQSAPFAHPKPKIPPKRDGRFLRFLVRGLIEPLPLDEL